MNNLKSQIIGVIIFAILFFFLLTSTLPAAPKKKSKATPAPKLIPAEVCILGEPSLIPITSLEITDGDSLKTQIIPRGWVVQVIHVDGILTVRVVNPYADK